MPTWNIVNPNNGIGYPNSHCTEDTRANFQRLLKVKESRSLLEQQNEDADIQLVTSVDWGQYKQELDFIKRMKSKGKKTIVTFSGDSRWLNGSALASPSGENYIDLCAEADAILGAIHPDWKVFGRFQDKVIYQNEPLENVSIKGNKNKDIDILLVGSSNHFCYALEIAYMLLDKNPKYNCVIGCLPQYIDAFRKTNPRLNIEETGPHSVFETYLKRSKVLVNTELKARGGRIPTWAFYANIPAILGNGAFISQIYPDITFNKIDLQDIVEKTEFAINKSAEIMDKAKELAKPFYFPEWERAVYQKLGL
jgi:hypothetical protein